MTDASPGPGRVGQLPLRWLVLAVVLIGNFASGVVFTLLSVARHDIAIDLGTTDSLVLWSFTAPSLAGAVCGPALGKLGDLIGHRRLYLIGLAGGLVTSVAVSLSWNVGSLIAFRAAGAAVTASLNPSSLALIFQAFDREDRVRAMGYWSLVGAGSPVLGVLIGGPIVEAFGWRAMFVAQVPCYVFALSFAWRLLPETQRRAVEAFDWRGAVLLACATLGLLLGVNRGPAWGWTDTRVLVSFAVVPVAGWTFLSWQRRAPFPLIPLRIMGRRNVSFGIGAQVLAQFAYTGAGIILANDLLVGRPGFGLSLAEAGRATIARPIVFALIAPLAGILAVKAGERFTATAGMAVLALSMGMLALSPAGSSLIVLVVAIGVSGLGMGMASPSLSTSVANAVPEHRLGVIGAAQQLVVQSASVIGTQVLVTVAHLGGGGQATVGGYRAAFVVALLTGVAAAITASGIRRAVRS